MAILHGSWILPPQVQPASNGRLTQGTVASEGYFLLWGEVWRRVDPLTALPSQVPIAQLPFTMSIDEMRDLLRSLHQAQFLSWNVTAFPLVVSETSTSTLQRGKRKTNLSPKAESADSLRWRSMEVDLPTYVLNTSILNRIAQTGAQAGASDTELNTELTGKSDISLNTELGTELDTELNTELSAPSNTELGTESDDSLCFIPQHSAAQVLPEGLDPEETTLRLQSWQVSGICLNGAEALQFLQSLPLSSVQSEEFAWLSQDLRFWSHVARWSLALLARAKFLPTIELPVRAPQLLQQTNSETSSSSQGALSPGSVSEGAISPSVVSEGVVSEGVVSEGTISLSSVSESSVSETNGMATAIAQWQVLIDSSVDQSRLEQFAHHMPLLCRTYKHHSVQQTSVQQTSVQQTSVQQTSAQPIPENQPTYSAPHRLLLDFLNCTIATQVRSIASAQSLPTLPLPKDTAIQEWLQSLGQETTFTTDISRLERLNAVLSQWITPLQQQVSQQLAAFRTCLYLRPPEKQVFPSSEADFTSSRAAQRRSNLTAAQTANQTDWTLEYYLQATNDPEFLMSARMVWNNPVERLEYLGRSVPQPQETLLAGLGLAARLYPVLESSLQVAQPQACSLHPLQVYEFLKSTAWRLQDSGIGVVLPPSLASQGGWANRIGLSVRAEAPDPKKNRLGLQSLLNFKWELTIGGQRLSKAEFDRLVALNTPLVEINGEWVELRAQDIKAAQTFFESRKDQMSLSLEDALRISTGDTQMIEKLPVVGFAASGALQQLINILTGSNQSVELIEPPKNLNGELRPYQLRGTSWLSFLEQWGLGACLADDMGLGKTIQFIAFLLHLQEQDALEQPTLLVCPTSVLGNWEREVKRFAPSLKVLLHHGDKRFSVAETTSTGAKSTTAKSTTAKSTTAKSTTAKSTTAKSTTAKSTQAFAKAIAGYHLVITSYSLVHRDLKQLQGVAWQGIVLDEAQNIKNADAKQAQSVRQLDAQFRIALTGTPVENRLSELWSIMDFLNPGYLGPKNFFQRRFAIPIERYGDTDSLKTLRSLVQPFILRRLKTDRSIIQDLPEKQEMTVFCALTQDQAALYQKLVEASLIEIESAEGIKKKGMILALLTKLKQVCNHPTLLKAETESSRPDRESQVQTAKRKTKTSELSTSKSELSTSKSELSTSKSELATLPSELRTHSGKLQRLEEMLEEVLAEGDRCLIFTQFAEWGKLLQADLARRFNREVLFLYGSTSQKQREEMVDRFQNDPQGPRIFILSLKAGGVGLNLTRANHVFHFDRWWNPAVENQATDRVFRIGQKKNVQVHKFVCTGTLEERIHELIESKRALSEQIVGAGESWLTELDTDALRSLLLLDRTAVIEEEEELLI